MLNCKITLTSFSVYMNKNKALSNDHIVYLLLHFSNYENVSFWFFISLNKFNIQITTVTHLTFFELPNIFFSQLWWGCCCCWCCNGTLFLALGWFDRVGPSKRLGSAIAATIPALLVIPVKQKKKQNSVTCLGVNLI